MNSRSRRMPSRTGGSRLALILFLLGAVLGLFGACYALRRSKGGGQTSFDGRRDVDPRDVALPRGYRIEALVTGLDLPSAVAFDERGRVHVLEAGYSYGEVWAKPRLLRIEPDGTRAVVAEGENPPWNGVVFHEGAFFVAEGGHREGGRLLRISPEGEIRVLIGGLPSLGDHHTNGPAIGPDGWLYFGQGSATNSGVVGMDNAELGWLESHREFHDIPARDIRLAGRNFRTEDPLQGGQTLTGAFVPFGTPTRAGQLIRGEVPCTGAILRVRPEVSEVGGSEVGEIEVVAWGLRNPFGLRFGPDGRLYATDNGYDERGSRPVFGAGDLLWRIEPGTWYGWPDFHGAKPLTDGDFYAPPAGERPRFLLAEHPGVPPAPVAVFGVHSSSDGLDFSTSERFGFVGDAFVAQFGDMAPGAGKVLEPVGFKVVRVELDSGAIDEFAVNRSRSYGPASRVGGGGLERPLDVKFDPSGEALYVVDFGVLTTSRSGPEPRRGTGVLWRITRGERP